MKPCPRRQGSHPCYLTHQNPRGKGNVWGSEVQGNMGGTGEYGRNEVHLIRKRPRAEASELEGRDDRGKNLRNKYPATFLAFSKQAIM
jgi:hypothetical protein